MHADGIEVEIVRRNIKHLYLRVCAPDGRVQARVPQGLDDAAVKRVVRDKLAWIRHQQQKLHRLPRPLAAHMASGEMHHFLGTPYRLEVVETGKAPGVKALDDRSLLLQVRPGSQAAARLAVLENWYRAQLKALLPALIDQWQRRIGVTVAEVRIRKMKTRWGTCNIGARRIWLNLALARTPPACLEYILVHEMVHLLERLHNRRFRSLMDRFLPDWRQRQAVLNAFPPASGSAIG